MYVWIRKLRQTIGKLRDLVWSLDCKWFQTHLHVMKRSQNKKKEKLKKRGTLARRVSEWLDDIQPRYRSFMRNRNLKSQKKRTLRKATLTVGRLKTYRRSFRKIFNFWPFAHGASHLLFLLDHRETCLPYGISVPGGRETPIRVGN